MHFYKLFSPAIQVLCYSTCPPLSKHIHHVRQTAARSLRARTGYLCAQGERWNPLQPLCAYLAALQAVRRGKEHDENLNWAF